jgi:hypothetical protein
MWLVMHGLTAVVGSIALSLVLAFVYAVATQLEKWFESLRVRTSAAHRDGSVLAGRAVAETADGRLDEPRRRAG